MENQKPDPWYPKVMTIAGSDSGGGAGIQADLKTFTVLGTFGTSAITAITAQNTLGVEAVQLLPPDIVRAQIRAVLSDIGTHAAKTGMLGDEAIIIAVADLIAEFQVPNLVVDPVMIAKSGHHLLLPGARNALVNRLLPLAKVATPNLHEAGVILNREIKSLPEMRLAAKLLHQLGPAWVVVKGGHLSGEAVDLAFNGEDFYELKGNRSPHTPHGTGCTFSAAIAAYLAKGLEVLPALEKAKAFIDRAISEAPVVGKGYRPTNHLAGLSNSR
ncbi:MAG: bifunctional hydroxymethylpyrimidine kinase/phosphomethylpyrimidine kinase [Syntrophomonadaceae bacterium]|nr:bifunctional hydroxymethylpyrimidine kinase/phosphomethylpyrimidine kinase [Syntrophomonadaceae bacterium]